MAGRSNLEKSGEQHVQMHKQMRSGRGNRDKGEEVERNYMITNSIFATEEATTTLVRHSRQTAILLLHSSHQLRSELKAHAQPSDDLIRNALTS